MTTGTTIISLSLLILPVALWLAKRMKTLPYPPGPPGDPIIGHLRVIPPSKTSNAFQKWNKDYGDVIHLQVLNRQIIVLGSAEAAQELLNAKGSNYKCRPSFPVQQLMGLNKTLGLMPYGDDFLKQRKMIQQFLAIGSGQEKPEFNHAIAEEAGLLLKNLHATSGTRHLKDIHRYTVSTIMRIAFGHRVKSDDDVFLPVGDVVSESLLRCGPMGNTPIDFFPWLRHFPTWFPGSYYAGIARPYADLFRSLGDNIIDHVRVGMASGEYESSFASQKLEELDLNTAESAAEELEHIKGVILSLFIGALDTSKASLGTFFLLMLHHPEVQDRAYEEIMTVFGPGTLPTLGMRESLPYVDAVVQEVLRWNPVAPLGVPHRTMEDDTFRGMFIPQDAMIITNLRGMSRDERVYSNPETFDPTRFLPKPHGRDEPEFASAFGFGRRICPGRFLADLSQWHAIAYILATLKITPDDDSPSTLDIDEDFEVGIVSDTKPFTCKIRVRSEAARQLISQIE